MTQVETTTLYRPTGANELALVGESDWRAWPPRLYWQPIFYPVLSFEYAEKIARDWNSTSEPNHVGYVTRFEVRSDYLSRYEAQTAGSSELLEYWIPAEDLDEFNANIVGRIEVVATYRRGERVENE